jgi:hypothetical protein
MCSHSRKNRDVSEEMLFVLRYTDQEARHEWVTMCRFHYDFDKQWIEKVESRSKPVLTFGA